MPKFEKNIPIKDITVIVQENKHKCSIDVKTGNIYIDPQFDTNPCMKASILGHELGHFYYATEWKCDVFSAWQMLQKGYNPSQCMYANGFCLSDNAEDRKDILFTWLQKVKCHE